jgi:hypothetical protein
MAINQLLLILQSDQLIRSFLFPVKEFNENSFLQVGRWFLKQIYSSFSKGVPGANPTVVHYSCKI